MSIEEEFQAKLEAVVSRIISTHDVELAKFGGAPGIREPGGLAGGVGRVLNALALNPEGTFDALDVTGMLTHSILKVHAFVDGNKRAGYANMMGMLDQAGFHLPLDKKVLEDKIVEFASSSGDWEVISAWLHENAVLRDGYEAADIKTMPSVAPK